uniref:Uncharacterized protein n=1 Tax=Heliothis virescens TaxID=7102 RepID=A0A2A4JEU8_HELVI
MIIRLVSLVIICVFVVNGAKVKVKSKMGPSGMSFHDTTNCSTFSKFGRFNPYSVLHEKWFVFFYWAHPRPLTTFLFTFPTANHTKHLKKILDGNTILPVMWSARQILMEDQDKEVSLLVERGDRGEYWNYPLYKVKKGGNKITPRDVRLKQTGDNRILGFMDCADETLLVMARMNDVPPKNRLQEEASRLGYRGRRGKSYLYQGHEWVPIPEDDEKLYWKYTKDKKETPSTDVKASNQSSNEELPADEPNKNKKDVKPAIEPQVTVPEEELQARCDKIEPEPWDHPKPKPVDPDKIPITSEELNDAEKYLLEDTNTQTIEPTEKVLPEQENGPVKEIKKEYKNQNDAIKSPGYTEEYSIKRQNKNNKVKRKKPENVNNCNACFQMKAIDDGFVPEDDLPYQHPSDTSNEPTPTMQAKDSKFHEKAAENSSKSPNTLKQ